MFDKYRKTRNIVTKPIQNNKRKYFRDTILTSNQNGQQLWKSVKMILGNSKTCSVPLDIKCDDFNEYFTNIGAEIYTDFDNDDFYWKGPDSIYDFKVCNVSDNHVCKHLEQFHDKSNIDVLGFDSKLLKLAANIISKPLAFMFNASFNSSIVLTDWKTARICPVYKGKGNKNDKTNYRPISVISHVAKIYEKCVQSQLLHYLNQHDLISVDQSAFIKHHSTQTLLHKVTDNWYENIENGLITGVCYFDVAKCFDSISHEVLLFKLEKYGIRGTEHCWFRSYLTGRMQATLCNNTLSNFNMVKAGVPQGSILGPLLFILFMSDLPIGISEIFKFADDTMINVSAESVYEVNEKLQCNINKVHTWFNHNRLKLNVNKSCAMYVGTRQKLANNLTSNEKLTINDNELMINESYPYIGLTVDSTLSWNNHIDMLCKKLSIRVGVLYRLSQILPKPCLITLYYTLVQSVIDYGLTVCSHTSQSNIVKIQRFQNRAAGVCTQCFTYDIPSSVLLNNLGWLNINKRREYLTGILMFKCMSGEAPNYLSDHFVESVLVHDRTMRHTNNQHLYIPFAHTNYYKNSLSIYGANLWNGIPADIKNVTNICDFKRNFKSYLKYVQSYE